MMNLTILNPSSNSLTQNSLQTPHTLTAKPSAQHKTWAIAVTPSLHLLSAAGAAELATGLLSLAGAAPTALKNEIERDNYW